MSQIVRLLMPPIPTIEERGPYSPPLAVVAIAMFSKLPAAHLCVH